MTKIAKNKIRVAVFIPVFGIPSEVWSIRQCLGFKDIEPIVVCWHIHPEAPRNNYGLECHELTAPWKQQLSVIKRIAIKLGISSAVLPDADEQLEIKNLLNALNIDAVLCHFSWTGIRVAVAAGNTFPMIWHVHGRDISSSLKSSAYKSALRKLLPTAAKVVAVGSFQLDILKRLGLGSNQGVLIPCGAPINEFTTRPGHTRPANTKIRIIYVGRLSPEKGPLETIQAFSLANKTIPNTELILVGDGELRESAEELTLKLMLQDKVTFLGTLPSSQIANELSKSHIYTQHSQEYKGWIEGFGVTLTEAGAAGLPLVVSRSGGIIDQVVDGQNGILFPPGDINAQAQAILELAQDENRRARMGASARQLAARFDSETQIDKLEHLLVDICRQQKKPGTLRHRIE